MASSAYEIAKSKNQRIVLDFRESKILKETMPDRSFF